jgi:hypothetical protein
MAVWFPMFNIREGEVPSIDELNYNYLTITDVASGYLNEQNWTYNGFGLSTDREDYYENEIGLKIVSNSVEADPAYTAAGLTPAASPTVLTIPGTGLWHEVMTASIDSEYGGQLWIIASGALFAEAQFGCMVAIELNGSIIWQDALGSGDDNDLDFFIWQPNQPVHEEAVGPQGYHFAMALDTVQRVTAGTHVVKVKIRSGRDPSPRCAIMNRELIVIEMYS